MALSALCVALSDEVCRPFGRDFRRMGGTNSDPPTHRDVSPPLASILVLLALFLLTLTLFVLAILVVRQNIIFGNRLTRRP